MKLLPEADWTAGFEGGVLILGLYQHGGYRVYSRVALSTVPNDPAALRDIETLTLRHTASRSASA